MNKPNSMIRQEIKNTTVEIEGPQDLKLKTGGFFAYYISTLAFIIILVILYIKFQTAVHKTARNVFKRKNNEY